MLRFAKLMIFNESQKTREIFIVNNLGKPRKNRDIGQIGGQPGAAHDGAKLPGEVCALRLGLEPSDQWGCSADVCETAF